MSKDLFQSELQVINIGLSSFTDPLEARGIKNIHVDWRPSIAVSADATKILAEKKELIAIANQKVLKKITEGKAVLIGMGKAIDCIPGMKKNLILHAGPPITWERMCGPMKGAIIGALLYEGMAQDEAQAETLAANGKIDYSPCHEHQTVGPMAGVVSPSMPVFILKNTQFGNLSYSTQNEGLGKVLRYGAYSKEVLTRLKWMETTLYPALKNAIEFLQEIDIKNIMAQALHMGDELHNRNRAGTSLFYRAIAPAIIESTADKKLAAEVLNFINSNDHFFLNLSMAASKAILDAAQNIKDSSVAVIMARNGTDFGIKLSGTGKTWFTGPAEIPDALFFPGYTKEDANPDIGDSAITETLGIGGFAMACAPAIVQFVGGKSSDALAFSEEMYEITTGENTVFQIPALNFRGTPTGIDVIMVIEKNILPVINTGVAHKKPGIGQVGAGVLRAPALPFQKAFEALAKDSL